MNTNLDRILKSYWDRQRIFPKTGKFLGNLFWTGRGVTQGDLASPMILNIVVDAVVQAVLDVVYGHQEAQHGLGWADRKRKLSFYADDGRIAGRNHNWVQDTLTVTVIMFRSMGLGKNLENIKAMVCMQGFIWGKWGEQVYKRRATGEGETFRERNRIRVSFT